MKFDDKTQKKNQNCFDMISKIYFFIKMCLVEIKDPPQKM